MHSKRLLSAWLALLFAGCAMAQSTEPFYKDTPLAFLEWLKTYENGVHTFTISGQAKGWISEDDIPALLEKLDSTEPCAGVMSSASSSIPGRSTVGDQAAFMIDGFRTRLYPPKLASKKYTKAEKQDLRNWWRQYERAVEVPRN
jgi:hypothetical protein